jgi:sugar-specific transcriptional regulator TrmB
MTQEWIVKTLLDLGFKQKESEVYAFLALNGAKNVNEITKALNTYERQVYRTLKSLVNSHIITITPNTPAQYSALPFDKVLELLVKVTLKEAERIEMKKEKILSVWNSCIKNDSAG